MSALYTVYILARHFTTAPHPPDRPAQIMSSEPRSRNSFGHRNKTVQSSLGKPFAGHGGGAGGGGGGRLLGSGRQLPPQLSAGRRPLGGSGGGVLGGAMGGGGGPGGWLGGRGPGGAIWGVHAPKAKRWSGGGGGVGTRPWWLALLACGGA